MVEVTMIPTRAESAGTRPNPYLVTEKQAWNGLHSCMFDKVSADSAQDTSNQLKRGEGAVLSKHNI